MTVKYVSSVDGSDADDGSTWALAKATVAGALAALTGAGPHQVYVDSAHDFTSGAAITWNAAVADQIVSIISADRSTGEPPTTWTPGAKETVGADGDFNIATSGSQYLYIQGITIVGRASATFGMDIIVGTANAFDVTAHVDLVSCTLTVPGTSNGSKIQLGPMVAPNSGDSSVTVRNCLFNITDSTTATPILIGRGVKIAGLTIGFAGANKPTLLFDFSTANGPFIIRDSDLSGYNTTGGAYFDQNLNYMQTLLENCKLSSTPALTSGTWTDQREGSITLVNVDSGDTHNVFEYRNRLGTLTEDSSNYANNGAQFDGAGISWLVVTTASCSEANPFVCPWVSRWTTATGSQDLHLQLIRDSATDYTDREVWAEFEVLESASFPNGTLTSTRNAKPFVGTGVDLTNSSEVWTESLANDNEMEIRVTRTIAEKSLARGRLVVGVASTTLYVDPVLRIGA